MEQWQVITFVEPTYEQCKAAVKLNIRDALPYVIEHYPDYALKIIGLSVYTLNEIDRSVITKDFSNRILKKSSMLFASLIAMYDDLEFTQDQLIQATKQYPDFISAASIIHMVHLNRISVAQYQQLLDMAVDKIKLPYYCASLLINMSLHQFLTDRLMIRAIGTAESVEKINSLLESYRSYGKQPSSELRKVVRRHRISMNKKAFLDNIKMVIDRWL